MSGARPAVRRSEIVSTVVVLVLVALGVFALWPRDPAGTDPGTADDRAAVVVPDAELVDARAAAALPPCTLPDPTASFPPPSPQQPLYEVRVSCLGAPGEIDLGQLVHGRPALLNVWASWCGPCRDELPVLAEYAARPDAVTVIGVDVRDDPRAALALLDELDVALPSVTDPDGELRDALDLPPGLPMSYLVAADGSVTRVDPPTPFASADEVAAAVAPIRCEFRWCR